LGRLAGWQKLWIVLAVSWIAAPIALLWSGYPRAEPWRQAFITQRLSLIESEREAAYGRLAAECQPAGDKYDLVSPKRRIEFLICMQERKGEQDALTGRYLRAKAGVNDEAEQSVRDDLPRARWRVIGKGLAFWLAPVFSLYALGFAIARLRRADPSLWARPRE
jgi:hypothetical protein